MTEIKMLAIDLAKGSFQVCAVGSDGTVLHNRAFSRSRLIALLSDQPICVVAMEACATSHYWGRVAQRNGREVRLVPAIYVKPFVKRQKNDRADAEAISEAASRSSMRFVAVKRGGSGCLHSLAGFDKWIAGRFQAAASSGWLK